MKRDFHDLTTAYIGPNQAHVSFREALANAKALAMILGGEEPDALGDLLKRADAARTNSPDGTFALGMVGRANKTQVQFAVHLCSNEFDLVADAPGGFQEQLLGLVLREAYRGFETFLIGLFEEIALADARVLKSSKKITHQDAIDASEGRGLIHAIIEQRKGELTRAGLEALMELFANLNLPLCEPADDADQGQAGDVLQRLRWASATRNLIEHNSAVVNQEYLRLVPDTNLQLGDRVRIGTPELGDVLSAVEWTADQLNRRAVDKYPIATVGADRHGS